MKVSGLDVHKDTIFCAIYDGKKYGKVTEFATFSENMREMAHMLRERGVKKIAMSPQGMVVEPYHYMKEFMRKEGEVKDLVITIGGFPHGDYLSPVYELTEESVSIYPVMLTVWTVVAELLTSYRLAADLTTPNVSPSEEA